MAAYRWLLTILCLTNIVPMVGASEGPPALAYSSSLRRLPIAFEQNVGQARREAIYVGRTQGYILEIMSDQVKFHLAASPNSGGALNDTIPTLTMKLPGAAKSSRVTGMERTGGFSNYFLGSDSRKWLKNIPQYKSVQIEDVWPGIDLVFYGAGDEIEYDFLVAPGSDAKRISLEFSGMDTMEIDAAGNLALKTVAGAMVHRRPQSFQSVGKHKNAVVSNWVLTGPNRISLSLGEFDRTQPLIVDPKITFVTAFYQQIRAIAADRSGNVYLTGSASTMIPVNGDSYQRGHAGNADAFVTKINSKGSSYVYSTYLGGSGSDSGYGIAVDSEGSAYVVGRTMSADFPVFPAPGANPYPRAYAALGDGYICRLSPAGNALEYSTAIGGEAEDELRHVVVNANREAFAVGRSNGPGFPTTPGGIYPTHRGLGDAVIVRVNAAGTAPVMATYYGGTNSDEEPKSIAIDSSNNIFIVGWTVPLGIPDFPASNTRIGGIDAFTVQLNGAGSAVKYSRFLGSTGTDEAYSVVVDPTSNVYIAGRTNSSNLLALPSRPFSGVPGATSDGFVARTDSNGTVAPGGGLYLGGIGDDYILGMAIDAANSLHLTGWTQSVDFPTTTSGDDRFYSDAKDAFYAQVAWNGLGLALRYSSLLGRRFDEIGYSVAADGDGSGYIAGSQQGDLQATTGAVDQTGGWTQYAGFVAAYSPPYPTNRRFVEQLFADIFNRPLDSISESIWVGALNSGGVSRGDVPWSYYNSPEFANRGIFHLVLCYIGALGRDADYAGYQFWSKLLEYGVVYYGDGSLYSAFANSREFNSRWGPLDDVSYINRIFVNTLGRTPSVAEVDTYRNRISIYGRGIGLRDLVNSAESIGRNVNRLYANYMILTLFARSPSDDAALINSVASQLSNGVPGAAIAGWFVESPEFLKRF